MAEQDPREEPDPTTPGEEAADDAEPASTPFDNPFFLPLVLLGFAVWFVYDGWFNPEMEWIRFNRVLGVMFVILGLHQGAGALGYAHPAALPAILFGFAGWFAYDGFLNPGLEWWASYVNQAAALGCVLLAAYRILRARKDPEGEGAGASASSDAR